MNLTIKDIAQMANVSQGTVSKVLNNYEGISEKTKKKVMDIINQNGYEPNFSARSLATKKSNLIGLIYAGRINVDMTHPYFNEVISSFKKNIGLLHNNSSCDITNTLTGTDYFSCPECWVREAGAWM